MRRARVAVAMVAVLTLGGCVQVTTAPPETPSGTVGTASPGGGQGGGGKGNGYRFLHTRGNGQPVRWSTCRPIRYVVRPANEPDGARQLLKKAVARISEVTGLEFSFAGTTNEGPSDNRKPFHPNRYGDDWSPVLVTYSNPNEYPRLKGGAAGYGGPAFVRAGGGAPRFVSGMVVFDVEQMSSMGDDAVLGVMLHELAHVVGLGHVKDRGQLMNPVQYGRGVTDLQEGDLKGLRALGKGKCYEPIEPQRFGG